MKALMSATGTHPQGSNIDALLHSIRSQRIIVINRPPHCRRSQLEEPNHMCTERKGEERGRERETTKEGETGDVNVSSTSVNTQG